MNMAVEGEDFHGAKLALFVGGGELAVILRDDDPSIVLPNHWDFPGGGREGDEGRMWRLMSPEQYSELPNHIPKFAGRLSLYLSGVAGDPFERTPR